MCFSPEASFAGGIIISTIGVVAVKKVHKPSQLLFAIMPLFFVSSVKRMHLLGVLISLSCFVDIDTWDRLCLLAMTSIFLVFH